MDFMQFDLRFFSLQIAARREQVRIPPPPQKNAQGRNTHFDLPTIAPSYFPIGISKYISSVPFASLTPLTKMRAPARGAMMSSTSKKRNPDCVV